MNQKPEPMDYPLANAMRRLARWWFVPPLAAARGALLFAGLALTRPSVYESHSLWIISPEAEMESLAALLAAKGALLNPSAEGEAVERAVETVVDLTGRRIHDKDQTLEQYMASYSANRFARVAGSEAVLNNLMMLAGEVIRSSWPEAEKDMGVLRREAIRVYREKPENVVTLSFRAGEAGTAQQAMKALCLVIRDEEAKDRQQRSQALMKQARVTLDDERFAAWRQADGQSLLLVEPAVKLLAGASPAVRVAPAPLTWSARGALAVFLFSILALILPQGTPISRLAK